MSQPIQVPDELYAAIAEYARQRGGQPDAIINTWLREAVEQAKASAAAATHQEQGTSQDQLTLLAGMINVPDPDAGDHHDAYFGSDDGDA